jgi:hypothetical protein
MTKTSKARIETLHTTALEALDQAFTSTTSAMAACCLQTALSAVQQLVRIGEVNPALHEAVNETRVALMARGWC